MRINQTVKLGAAVALLLYSSDVKASMTAVAAPENETAPVEATVKDDKEV